MNAKDNALLTRVGPGTPMGALMREYWIPACLSSELEAGGSPVRLMLLGEKLVGFRTPEGEVGIMDHACPHRCASLFYGRNEPGGLRCVYHGWKFAPDGQCLEQPNVPAEKSFAKRLKAPAYPVQERGGVVWVYMGTRETPPPFTGIEATLLPESDLRLSCSLRHCNYLQVLEGEIDTSHFGFLHGGAVAQEDLDPNDLNSMSLRDRAPLYHVAETGAGTSYAAYRDTGDGQIYYRVAHYLLPFYTQFPDGNFAENIVLDAAVPMDDEHTMIFTWMYTGRTAGVRRLKDGSPIPGLDRDEDYLPNGTGWFDRWRTVANAGNDYLIDREAQAARSYTGMTGVQLQDQAIVESMGGIADRTKEHLSVSDHMIVMTRRRILGVLREHQQGLPPPGLENSRIFQQARSGAFLADPQTPWREAYAEQVAAAFNPTGVLHFDPENMA
ncbi:Rieske 2Fe-2S domain-containing protein [Novosphingobium naphthalenivorans]|uniref:Rieske 2Fe-2S domain-containing protein n=1 Tax=Novosphingobium naphthalenivorans TaxID=273168 RepID=UPI0008364A56|nr:Rieske 2Fe-2S domain-containing protein [Novosphingobium naphthalenivorans]